MLLSKRSCEITCHLPCGRFIPVVILSSEWNKHCITANMKKSQPLLHTGGSITCPNPELQRLQEGLKNTHPNLPLQGIAPKEMIKNAGELFMPSAGQVIWLVRALSHTPQGCWFDYRLGRVQEATDQCFPPHLCFFFSLSPSESKNQ